MRNRGKNMFKLLKYVILIALVVAMIYFLSVRFTRDSMVVTLKNHKKLDNIEQDTMALKKRFSALKGGEAPARTVKKENKSVEDKQGLNKFIKQHAD